MWKWFVKLSSSSHTFLTTDQCWYWKLSKRRDALGKSMENIWSWQLEKMYYPLCMKIFGYGNGWKALQKCHVVTIAHCTFGHSHIWKKWPTRCQQGVNRVSTRCQQGVKFVISARGKKCEVILSVFCLSSEIIFVFVFAFAICFWREGRSSKKIDILKKWRGGEKETKCGFNKRSITPPYWHSDTSVL